ncbi:MAG TPA: hypothetical protein VGB93_02390 [Methylovirgula sp.]
MALLLLAFAVGGVLGSFYLIPSHADEDSDNDNPNPAVRLTIKDGVPTLTLTAEEQQNAGVIAAKLDVAPPRDYMRGFGTVLDPAGLADLENQYLEAETQIVAAKSRLGSSQAAYQRAQVLNKDQENISTAQLQSARSSFDVDTNALAAAQAQSAAIIANTRQTWGETIAKALASGGPEINDLLARNHYLVRVTLPPDVTISTPPSIASALYGATDVRLRFVSLASTADPKLQGISYLYEAPAQNLLPGLSLEVTLAVASGQSGLIVPDSAVVWLEGKPWIYIRTQPTIFIRKGINPTSSTPRGGFVVSGLPVDARIVIQGAQMLLSEEFRASVPVED